MELPFLVWFHEFKKARRINYAFNFFDRHIYKRRHGVAQPRRHRQKHYGIAASEKCGDFESY